MKVFSILVISLILTGCGTHAKIDVPVTSKVDNSAWFGKKFHYSVRYSQPTPGVFSGGEEQPLVPLKQAKISQGAAMAFNRLADAIYNQYPLGVKRGGQDQYDYLLEIDLIAREKSGPAYPDYQMAESFGANVLTLGLAPANYDIIADFDVTYRLVDMNKEVLYEKEYKVHDSVEHQRKDFDSLNSLYGFSAQLFEKHIALTLSNFLSLSAKQ